MMINEDAAAAEKRQTSSSKTKTSPPRNNLSRGTAAVNYQATQDSSFSNNNNKNNNKDNSQNFKRSIPQIPASNPYRGDRRRSDEAANTAKIIGDNHTAVIDYGKVPPRRSETRIDRDLRKYLSQQATGIVVGTATQPQQEAGKVQTVDDVVGGGHNSRRSGVIVVNSSERAGNHLQRQSSAFAATPRTQRRRTSKLQILNHHNNIKQNNSLNQQQAQYPDRRSQFHRRSLPLSPLRLNMMNATNTNRSSPARTSPTAAGTAQGPLPDPVEVFNGSPSYINLLDALNAWQLAKDLAESLDIPAVASFKHVAPVGAAVGVPLTKSEAIQCMVDDFMPLTNLASAYARARGTDRIFAVGDFIALSDTCDLQTAKLLSREISDGIIAPSYEPLALDLLCRKKQGTYCILKIDPNYRASEDEERSVFGLRLKQKFSSLHVSPAQFENVVSERQDLPKSAARDLVLALICLKYAPNNSLCYAKNGQMIGMGMGQHKSRQSQPKNKLANQRAFNWWLRHHPRILRLPWKSKIKRAERVNAIDAYLKTDTKEDLLSEFSNWDNLFDKDPPESLTQEDRQNWKEKMKDVSLVSDAFYPFPENIDDWLDVGVGFVGCTGGSASDGALLHVCNERGIALCHTGIQMSLP